MASNPTADQSAGANVVWQDRRGMFQKGREVHQPSSPTARKFSETGVTNAVRRASVSSTGGGGGSPVQEKSPASNSAGGGGGSFPTASGNSRRRSSGGAGIFSGLNNMKRGSEDYAERRQSHTEMQGQGGMVSGWFNQTFKGHQKPGDSNQNKDTKRGVME